VFAVYCYVETNKR